MRYAVKLGGSAITVKSRPSTARRGVIARLAAEIARAHEPCLVVHGGGSFGHAAAKRYGVHEGEREGVDAREGLSRTHRAMERLDAIVVDALLAAGVPAVAVPPLAVCTLDNGRISALDTGALRFIAERGMTPVTYGDVARDASRGFSIVSGDQLLARLAPALGIGRVVLCSDVDGVYTADPKKDLRARRIDVLTPAVMAGVEAGGSVPSDVTGGMRGKLAELLPLARAGVEAIIIDALRPGSLERALRGATDQGTFIPVIP